MNSKEKTLRNDTFSDSDDIDDTKLDNLELKYVRPNLRISRFSLDSTSDDSDIINQATLLNKTAKVKAETFLMPSNLPHKKDIASASLPKTFKFKNADGNIFPVGPNVFILEENGEVSLINLPEYAGRIMDSASKRNDSTWLNKIKKIPKNVRFIKNYKGINCVPRRNLASPLSPKSMQICTKPWETKSSSSSWKFLKQTEIFGKILTLKTLIPIVLLVPTIWFIYKQFMKKSVVNVPELAGPKVQKTISKPNNVKPIMRNFAGLMKKIMKI